MSFVLSHLLVVVVVCCVFCWLLCVVCWLCVFELRVLCLFVVCGKLVVGRCCFVVVFLFLYRELFIGCWLLVVVCCLLCFVSRLLLCLKCCLLFVCSCNCRLLVVGWRLVCVVC